MSAQNRPNLLLICTDQQRFDTLGCYGNQYVETPTLDRLASEGVLFENCYVQNPICSPSRASLMTGRYVHSHGLWTNGNTIPDHEELFTQTLADNGYDCGLIGKLHLSPAFGGRTEKRLNDGFRYFQWAHDPSQGSPDNMYHQWLREHHPELYAQAIADSGHSEGLHEAVLFDKMPTEAHYSHWAAEKAIEFLTSARAPDKPFFLWVNFFDPHHPFVAPQEYLDRYDPAQLPRPIKASASTAPKPPIFQAASRESYAGHARGFVDHTPEEIQQIVAAYYAMVTLIDDEVSRILEQIKLLGLENDTVVVFTSDHGEMLGDHGVLLKGPILSEGAVRVPLIMRWPGHLPAGERRHEPVQLMDLCPTFLEAASLAPLPRNQAASILPVARGNSESSPRDWVLCEYRNSVYARDYNPPQHVTMLRKGAFKLVVYHGMPASGQPRTGELYDLAADPQELNNLWGDPAHRTLRTELQEFLLDVLVATEDRSQPIEADW